MTRLLLDRHLLLWWLGADARLRREAEHWAQAAEAEVLVSQASLREMAIKVSLGGQQWADLAGLERQEPLQGCRRLPIREAHLLEVEGLENDGEQRNRNGLRTFS